MNFEKLQEIAEAEVAQLSGRLPEEVAEAVARVPVFFEAMPNAEDTAEGIDPGTLGLFDEGQAGISLPHVRLWLANLWDLAEEDEAIFREEVRTTYLHEMGHFLGWDEADLASRDLD